jgi:FdhD protein
MAVYSERRGVVRQAGFHGLVGADEVAVEAQLSIRVRRESDAASHVVATTMRTPGADVELAVGFLVAERLLRTRSD